jgi:hypothetical protein
VLVMAIRIADMFARHRTMVSTTKATKAAL